MVDWINIWIYILIPLGELYLKKAVNFPENVKRLIQNVKPRTWSEALISSYFAQ